MNLVYINLIEPLHTPLYSKEQISSWPINKQKKYAMQILRICRQDKRNKQFIPNKCPYCSDIGFIRIVGHHDDYTQPLRVCFMCSKCHTREHWPEIK